MRGVKERLSRLSQRRYLETRRNLKVAYPRTRLPTLCSAFHLVIVLRIKIDGSESFYDPRLLVMANVCFQRRRNGRASSINLLSIAEFAAMFRFSHTEARSRPALETT